MKLYLNAQNNGITYNKKQYLLQAARRLRMEDIVVEYKGQDNPEFVLNIEPYGQLIRGTKWTGSWWIDMLLDNSNATPGCQEVDDVFFAISTKRIKVPKNGHLFFQACDPEIHRPQDIKPEFDFVLCGTNGGAIYEERGRCIGVLKKAGFTFGDLGKDRNPLDYVKENCRGRVQFIRSMNVDKEGEIAQRFFESIAIGATLTNYVPDLEKTGLVEGRDYFSYKNDDEMISKMRVLIKYPEVLESMATKGRQKALLCHTYDHRLISILNIIKERST